MTLEPTPPKTAGEALAELFHYELAHSAITGEDPELGRFETLPAGATGELDRARADLVQRISEAETGSVLAAEMENFIPAVMAAMPLIRKGMSLLGGRDKIVALIAKPLAELISGLVGPDKTAALSRAIADTGLKMLGLEVAGSEPARLGAEGLASAAEDAIRAVASLDPAAQADPLRVRTELQEAFAEAAARHLPKDVLRSDLDSFETEDERGVWVLMPRSSGRQYRYRQFSRTFPVVLTRPLARGVLLEDGENLEDRLAEASPSWPLEAEIHLYEALPGTQVGHMAAPEVAGEGAVSTGDFHELTAESAAMLLQRPGLAGARPGRRDHADGHHRHGHHPSGSRYYRVVVKHHPNAARRRVRRLGVRLTVVDNRPSLHIHLRMSEEHAHRLAAAASGGDVKTLAELRSAIHAVSEPALAHRIVKAARHFPSLSLSMDKANGLATVLSEQMIGGLSAQIASVVPALIDAAKSPHEGATISFRFDFADPASMSAGKVGAPLIKVRAGWHRD